MDDIARVGQATAPPPLLDRLEHACVVATRPVASLGVAGMLIAAGATVLDVLMRWLFNSPFPALNEVVAMLFAVAIAATIPSGLANKVNLRIDLLSRFMTPRLGMWLDAIGALLLLGFFTVLSWQMYVYAGQLAEQGRATVMLGIPEAPFIYGVAAMFVLGCVVQLIVMLNQFRQAIVHPAPQPGEATHPLFTRIALVVGVAALVFGIYVAVNFEDVSTWAQSHVAAEVLYAFLCLWLFMLGLVPLAAGMALVGLVGSALLMGLDPALSAFGTTVEGFLTNSQVGTLPLFLMMGSFAATAGMATDLYNLAHAMLGRLRGGLAYATILGCAGFGALTSSSIATASLIGKVAVPEMRERGYSPALATGVCAAGGTLGALVPPSGPLIVFALLTEASVGRLFMGAFGPALLCVLLYCATVWLYVHLAPKSCPPSHRSGAEEIGRQLRKCGSVGALFFTVMGGLYLGVFTDTESAAVGAFGAFLAALHRGKLKGGAFWRVMAEVTAVTAMIYGLIFGAQTLSFFVAVSSLTDIATDWVASLHWANWAVMALLLFFFLVLGSLMESFAVMVITVPIVTPLILSMGYDIVWWGIIQLAVVETGLIHPPLGLNVFVLKSVTPDVPMWTIYKGVFPYVLADFVKLGLLVAFPIISLFLVNAMLH
ncbi:MAG TPA: TRAP transporter large permease subunit [Stellaceae bacterium]|nr:TRAP transporter large permease subunit [Stellaceae bacterium]